MGHGDAEMLLRVGNCHRFSAVPRASEGWMDLVATTLREEFRWSVIKKRGDHSFHIRYLARETWVPKDGSRKGGVAQFDRIVVANLHRFEGGFRIG